MDLEQRQGIAQLASGHERTRASQGTFPRVGEPGASGTSRAFVAGRRRSRPAWSATAPPADPHSGRVALAANTPAAMMTSTRPPSAIHASAGKWRRRRFLEGESRWRLEYHPGSGRYTGATCSSRSTRSSKREHLVGRRRPATSRHRADGGPPTVAASHGGRTVVQKHFGSRAGVLPGRCAHARYTPEPGHDCGRGRARGSRR